MDDADDTQSGQTQRTTLQTDYRKKRAKGESNSVKDCDIDF